MRTTATLTAAAALLAGSLTAASAADMALKAPPPVPVGYDWTGWYGGVNGGGLWGDSRWRFLNAPLAADTFVSPEYEQGFVGVHGGFLHQFRGWNMGGLGLVIGLDHSALMPTDNYNNSAICPNVLFNCQAKIESLFTTGGVLGLAWDRFMISARGGWAGGNVNTRTTIIATNVMFDQTRQWHNGWYVGGAIDWVFYQTKGTSWIIGAEYQHVDLGEERHFIIPSVITPFVTRDVNTTTDVIKGKLTVKFDGPPLF